MKFFPIAAIAVITFIPTSAQAFDVGDALSIIGAVEGLTRDRGPREVESSQSIVDYDLECNLRGFDGWADGKCRNFEWLMHFIPAM